MNENTPWKTQDRQCISAHQIGKKDGRAEVRGPGTKPPWSTGIGPVPKGNIKDPIKSGALRKKRELEGNHQKNKKTAAWEANT